MSQEDFAARSFNDNLANFDPRNPYRGDESLPVQFFMGALLDSVETEKAGREIYRDVEMIKVIVNKDEIVVQPVDNTHKNRWPRQYAAWKSTGHNEPGMTGTPIDKLAGVTPAQVAEFKYRQIHSIEQLVDAPDSVLQTIPGMHMLRDKAKAYIQLAKDSAPLMAAAEVKRQNEELVKQNQELMARLTALEKKVK